MAVQMARNLCNMGSLNSGTAPDLIRRCWRGKVGVLIFVLDVLIHSSFLFTLIYFVIVLVSILLLLLLLFLRLGLWLVFGVARFLLLASLVLKLAAVFHLGSQTAGSHSETPILGLLCPVLVIYKQASPNTPAKEYRSCFPFERGMPCNTCVGRVGTQGKDMIRQDGCVSDHSGKMQMTARLLWWYSCPSAVSIARSHHSGDNRYC